MSQPIPHGRVGNPLGPEVTEALAAREPSRMSDRVPSRAYSPPEPHEKYALFEEEIPPNMDAKWLPTKIMGAENRDVMEAHKSGWIPARASDIPRISGYGVEYPQALIDAKLVTPIGAEAPIVIDDLMLVFRPVELSERARRAQQKASGEQVRNQMRRLQQAYRHSGGDLGIERKHGAAPRVVAPQSDVDLAEE